MKYKILNDKKGIGIDEAIPFILFIFIATFGVFLYHINEKIKSNDLATDIQLQKDILAGHEALIEYVSEPDGYGGNKADFISKSLIEKNDDAIKNDMLDYFSKKLESLNWYIEVRDSNKHLIFPALESTKYSSHEQYSSTQVAHSVASVLVPIANSDYISIELFFNR